MIQKTLLSTCMALLTSLPAAADGPNFTSDVIIDGELCVGINCTVGEPLDAITLKLKADNMRLKFEDTSTATGVPTTDWELLANDGNSGGTESFSIKDVTNSKTIMKLEADAPDNALYIDAVGRTGLGTSIPQKQLHIVDGDTPTLRLEQDGSSGWTPQTWDILASESGIRIRNETDGTIPFFIDNDAASNSLYIEGSSDIGLGTPNPQASLHITRSDGTGKLLLQDTGPEAKRFQLEMENNGRTGILLTDTSPQGRSWEFAHTRNGGFTFSDIDTDGSEFVIRSDGQVSMGPGSVTNFLLYSNGNLLIPNGKVTATAFETSSSRSVKKNFRQLDELDIMNKIQELQITRWEYRDADVAGAHIGPMSEDFHALFRLGSSDKRLSATDMASISLVGVKHLQKQNEFLHKENSELKQRLQKLESMLQSLAAGNEAK